jgi:hypothetical protein
VQDRQKDIIDAIEKIAAEGGCFEPVNESYYQAFMELNQPQIEKLAIMVMLDQEKDGGGGGSERVVPDDFGTDWTAEITSRNRVRKSGRNHMKTTATTEAVSSPPGEKWHGSQQWRQTTSCAGQKPRSDWKNDLPIQGAGRKSLKQPTPFVGIKPYGKSQITLMRRYSRISHKLKPNKTMTKLFISTALFITAAATAPAQLAELDYNLGTGNWEYGSLDPNGGVVTILNSFALPDGYSGGSFVTDPSTGSAYLQTGSSLYHFNLATGAIMGTPTLDTFIYGYGVGNGGLVGLAYNSGTGNWEYRNINQVTGSTTLLNTFALPDGLVDASFLTDPSAGSAYFLSGNNSLYSLNLATGAIINTVTLPSTIFAYGLGNGGLVGMTYNSGTGNFEYGSFDPNGGAVTTLNSFSLPDGFGSGLFVTDPSTDSTYFISGSTLYHLNLDTGAVENTSTLDEMVQAMGIDPVPEPSLLTLSALGGLALLTKGLIEKGSKESASR